MLQIAGGVVLAVLFLIFVLPFILRLIGAAAMLIGPLIGASILLLFIVWIAKSFANGSFTLSAHWPALTFFALFGFAGALVAWDWWKLGRDVDLISRGQFGRRAKSVVLSDDEE